MPCILLPEQFVHETKGLNNKITSIIIRYDSCNETQPCFADNSSISRYNFDSSSLKSAVNHINAQGMSKLH
jgi:hypothetical protein